MNLTDRDALARRFLHVNLNCKSMDETESFYGGLLGLSARMRTDPSMPTDGSILGLAGKTFCQTSFLYDERGGRGGCALEAIEYRDPALAVDANSDPLRPGIRSALLTAPDLDATSAALRAAGIAVTETSHGLISGSRAILVTDPDGVIVEVAQDGVPRRRGGALFGGLRLSTADLAGTAGFLRAIGFIESEPQVVQTVGGAQLAPGSALGPADCLISRFILTEDSDQFSLVVVEHPEVSGAPVPWGGNRQGLYRCALRVDNVEAALTQVPDGVEIMGDPVWCPLPGTGIDGLYIAFLRSPDGVVFEFVERPLSFFTR